MKALLVIDMQNDFLKGGSLEVPNGNEIINKINKLMESNNFDLIVATKDWHPQNHKSFAINNNKNIGDIIDLNGTSQFMWPTHCVKGSFGAEIHKDIRSELLDFVWSKGSNIEIDSYSAFFENDQKTPTGLGDFFKSKGVSEVFVVGLALDYCVKFTALDSHRLGFKTTVLKDLTKAVNINANDGEKACKELTNIGVLVE